MDIFGSGRIHGPVSRILAKLARRQKHAFDSALPWSSLRDWFLSPGPNAPSDIGAKLTAGFPAGLLTVAAEATAAILVAAMIAARNPTQGFRLSLAAVLLLGLARLWTAAAGRRLHDAHLLLTMAWILASGVYALYGVTSGDGLTALLACLSVVGTTASICLQNFAAPRMVGATLLLGLGPCAVGAVTSGDPLLLAITAQALLLLLTAAAASRRYRDLLVSTMDAARENDIRARHDALTGLLNRAGLADALPAKLASATAAGSVPAVFYLDLDGLKPINDRYGHAAGDRVLQMVARCLKEIADDDDVVARLGGDEFVIASTVVDRAAAFAHGNAMVAAVADLFVDLGTDGARIGTSVGVALFPDHGREPEELLRAADAALYEAKARGKGRCSVAATKPYLLTLANAEQARQRQQANSGADQRNFRVGA